jgi:hypothetical protein
MINPVYRKLEEIMGTHFLADSDGFIKHTSMIMTISITLRCIYFCLMTIYAKYTFELTRNSKKVFCKFDPERVNVAQRNCQVFMIEMNKQFGIEITSDLTLKKKARIESAISLQPTKLVKTPVKSKKKLFNKSSSKSSPKKTNKNSINDPLESFESDIKPESSTKFALGYAAKIICPFMLPGFFLAFMIMVNVRTSSDWRDQTYDLYNRISYLHNDLNRFVILTNQEVYSEKMYTDFRNEYESSLTENIRKTQELTGIISEEKDPLKFEELLNLNFKDNFCQGFVQSGESSEYLRQLIVPITDNSCESEILNSGLDIILALIRENSGKIA